MKYSANWGVFAVILVCGFVLVVVAMASKGIGVIIRDPLVHMTIVDSLVRRHRNTFITYWQESHLFWKEDLDQMRPRMEI